MKIQFLHTTKVLVVIVMIPSMVSYAQLFKETSLQSGISHKSSSLPSGVCVLDFNNDGWDDIILTSGLFDNTRTILYKNSNGNFTDYTVPSGLDILNTSKSNTVSVCSGDIDNDGYRDLLVTKYFCRTGLCNITLLKNNNGYFTDITNSSGINVAIWNHAVTFADINLDGYLDIYISGYLNGMQNQFDSLGNINGYIPDCYNNHLFINNKNNTFSDQTAVYNANDAGCTWVSVATDVDFDRDVDLLIGNDFGEWNNHPNALYKNNYPSANFTSVSAPESISKKMYCMGIAVGDIDNDNHLDYYFTNIGKNVLLHNKGDNTFENIAATAGVENEWVKPDSTCQTSWGCNFLDYDNDGFQDLFVACGWSNITFPNTDAKEKNKLYKNNGNGLTFTDVSEIAGIDSPLSNKGSAIIDVNNDGKMDIVTITTKMQYPSPVADSLQHSFLYVNNDDNNNHWIKVKLGGENCNRDGFGSRIMVYAGGHIYSREVEGGGSHASQNSSYNHFGIGDAAIIDSIQIYWLRGKIQTLKHVAVNQTITINENASYPTSISTHSTTAFDLSVFPTIVNDLHDLSIILPPANNESFSFLITDIYGTSKATGKINPGNNITAHPDTYSQADAMSSGCYLISIYDEKGYSHTGKFIFLSK